MEQVGWHGTMIIYVYYFFTSIINKQLMSPIVALTYNQVYFFHPILLLVFFITFDKSHAGPINQVSLTCAPHSTENVSSLLLNHSPDYSPSLATLIH